jgi:hypothetical protein
VLYIFGYEDTKYVPAQHGTAAIAIETITEQSKHDTPPEDRKLSFAASEHERLERLDNSIPRKTYVQRLGILNTSSGGWGKFLRHAYQPFLIMFTFPAIAYTAISTSDEYNPSLRH